MTNTQKIAHCSKSNRLDSDLFEKEKNFQAVSAIYIVASEQSDSQIS